MSTDNPSSLLKVLKITADQLFNNKQGLNDKEFNELSRKDDTFKKNLLLEIKDVDIIINQLLKSLKT